jgi:putative ABC transport system substrate-binding protein
MSFRHLIASVAVGAMASASSVAAGEDAIKLPIVAQIGPGTPQTNIGATSFLRGMSALGYVEGRNVSYDVRGWGNDAGKIPALLNDFVREKVAVIETAGGNPTAHAAQAATRTIPIVFGSVADPVADGLVASIARPGGNVTGMWQSDLTGKRLQLLRYLLPHAARAAILFHPEPWQKPLLANAPELGNRIGVSVRLFPIDRADQIGSVFAEIAQWPADAVLTVDSPLTIFNRVAIAADAAKARVALFCTVPQMAEDGCLLSYAADLAAMQQRAAYFVDRILKGANPGDLPVEQPTKFELVLNLKVAKTLGLSIPQTLLVSADQVIE